MATVSTTADLYDSGGQFLFVTEGSGAPEGATKLGTTTLTYDDGQTEDRTTTEEPPPDEEPTPTR